MNYTIYTEIVIDASKELVWKQLTNLEDYHKWNPFIVHAKGEIKEKNKLFIVVKSNGKTQDFQPIVQVVQQYKKFNWIGKVFATWLFKATHEFILDEINEKQVNLIHKERFSGLLAPIVFSKIKDSTKKGFLKMNIAIKGIVEK